ncbi:AAA family ATPase [Streptomyces sp. NPDC087440]|uniref:AAA family ATPase n=1 Tax=Streptomyces sp. NPDC087440 TaxID=3365790 RepID=UPI00381831C8
MREDSNAAGHRPGALLINGTVGVGKTTVAENLGDLLADAGVPHAVRDLDRLCQSWPAPPDDRFNAALTARNLRSVAGNCLAVGAERLILAGVAESREDRTRYAEAVGVDLTVCRLRVDLPVNHRRLAHRHTDDPASLDWHLARAGELAAILDRAAVDDFTVDATTLTARDVAAEVARKAGWL